MGAGWNKGRIAPGEQGRGLSMRLGSAWGATSGGAERLWKHRVSAPGLADGADLEGASFEAEVGYGIDALRGILTPYSGLRISEGGGQTYRLGGRWELGESVSMSLEGDRREKAREGEKPDYGVVLRGSMRW